MPVSAAITARLPSAALNSRQASPSIRPATYISPTLDNQRIRRVANGAITTIAGNGTDGLQRRWRTGLLRRIEWSLLDVAVDGSGNVYIADSGNGRIRLLTPGASPSFSVGGIIGAAYPAKGYSQPAAAGSLASAYGSFLVSSSTAAASGALPTSLGGVALEFNGGLRAPLMVVSGSQINFQVPWELAGQNEALISVLVEGQTSEPVLAPIAPFAPGIFSTNGQGTGQGAILDSSYRVIDSSNPATAGASVIQIYCTGLGPVTNQPPTGLPPLDGELSETTTAPTVTIGGAQAQVLFSGLGARYGGHLPSECAGAGGLHHGRRRAGCNCFRAVSSPQRSLLRGKLCLEYRDHCRTIAALRGTNRCAAAYPLQRGTLCVYSAPLCWRPPCLR